LQTIGPTLLENWGRIEESYRPTCKKIISFALTHEFFKLSELADTLLSGWCGQKDDVSESVKSLVKANILSNLGDWTFTLHSKVEKAYLVANMNKFR
jgi:hypothetical protein